MCRITFVDWINSPSGFNTTSFLSPQALHESDIVFFDPLTFARGLDFKYDIHEDQQQTLRDNCKIIKDYLSIIKKKISELNSLIDKGGLFVVKFNFPKCKYKLWGYNDIGSEVSKGEIDIFFWLKPILGKYEFSYHQGNTFFCKENNNSFASLGRENKTTYNLSLKGIQKQNVKVLATNNMNEPILVSIAFEDMIGQIILIPEFNIENENSHLVNAAIEYWKKEINNKPTPPPTWIYDSLKEIKEIDNLSQDIKGKQKIIDQTNKEKVVLEINKNNFEEYGKLLYETGKKQLETIVRTSLRLIDFDAPENNNKEYVDDYDFHIKIEGNIIAIGEITGTDKETINSKKWAQLGKWIDSDEIKPETKGILIGNANRLVEPSLREVYFHEDVVKRNKTRKFCLLPTFELYKIVCFILNNEVNDDIKKKIQKSIIECTSVYKFKEEEFNN